MGKILDLYKFLTVPANDQRQQADVSGSAGGVKSSASAWLVRKQVRWEEPAAGRKAEQRLRKNRNTKSMAEEKSDKVQVPPKDPRGGVERRGGEKINRKKANCKLFARPVELRRATISHTEL